jgi:two-component system, cell cycle response regulator DivK
MNARILVVDDTPTNLKLVVRVLAAEGFEVLQATDAEQAQKMLVDQMPDLILMDIALPGMDGLSLTRLLKADVRLRNVPVIALTAFAMKGDDRKAMAAGCDGYITKPINTRELARQVRSFLTSTQQKEVTPDDTGRHSATE